jgi:hypothetical protein
MTGQTIWRIKVRRTGSAYSEIVESWSDRRHAPVLGDMLSVVIHREDAEHCYHR